jgi:hypothetical protein
MPTTRLLLQKLSTAVQNTELCPGYGGVLSQVVTTYFPARQKQQQQHQGSSIAWHRGVTGAQQQHFHTSISREERELLRSAAARLSSSTGSSSSGASITSCAAAGSSSSSSSGGSPSASQSGTAPISASCDVPRDHVLHDLYRSRQQPLETSGSNTALYKLPSKISAGSVPPDEFQQDEHVLSRFYEEGVHGGLGRRFRRKVPLFQVCV